MNTRQLHSLGLAAPNTSARPHDFPPDPNQSPIEDGGPHEYGGTRPEHERSQSPQRARRELVDHSPRTIDLAAVADISFGRSPVAEPTERPQTVPREALDQLAACFTAAEAVMDRMLANLRQERVLVLAGMPDTGKSSAALMLLHRLGVATVRCLAPDTVPGALAEQLPRAETLAARPTGYILSDLTAPTGLPLREIHLATARDRLRDQDAYLVITVTPTAVLDGVPTVEWQPPPAGEVLASHLRATTGEETASELLALPCVNDFLAQSRSMSEVAAFAQLLGRHLGQEVPEEAVRRLSPTALEDQVQSWFTAENTSYSLGDRAFLIALAVFDGGPLAVAAELGDSLLRLLQNTEDPTCTKGMPVFGSHIGERLARVRAREYDGYEHTAWGPVRQRMAAFEDERTPSALLHEVWTGHPSSRPALVHWLYRLAADGRPLVRTRAAATVAMISRADLPSAMALMIEPWATSGSARHRLAAVGSLAFAHFVGTPHVWRIIDTWRVCDDPRLRWSAVRLQGLLGPMRPERALAGLRDALRSYTAVDPSAPETEATHALAESVELLLTSPAADRILSDLRRTLNNDQPARSITLTGFLRACRHTEDEDPHGAPLVLAWFARALAEDSEAAQGIPALWRAALADSRVSQEALEVLRDWVLIADRSASSERALTELLPTLISTESDARRLSHLLRTIPAEGGARPPVTAQRLLTALHFR
ncbi:hypothetical protein [Streptomyces cylindrosporus]|uniref:Uncharacterized protein n=1 Tax=Streptomyces cylindrosporus TaxID=2927583 RepID=A0ABS9YG40_9ACTN|nr:hypothetical protein [Streptomyces cylindrosporus]MCI3276207.1 hypothetical protein [Streptomyces cylindrosporus]